MFEKVLYPTKFEEFSLPILKSLTCLKAGGLKEVVLIHVIDKNILHTLHRSGIPVDENGMVKSAQRQLDAYVDYLESNDIKARMKIVIGSIVSEIIKTSTMEGVSLIVAGRQRRNTLGELFIGSTTDRIIRQSPVPVLVAKYRIIVETPGGIFERYCEDMFKKILYPTDWSSCAERVKEILPSLKAIGVSEVIAVHVIEPRTPLKDSESSSHQMEVLGKELKAMGFSVKTLLIEGKPYEEIILLAMDEGVSLITMGTHGLGKIEGILWGSVSQRVVEYSEKPVLVVK
jgi:nucleotide-binding universal stress UspA family protein